MTKKQWQGDWNREPNIFCKNCGKQIDPHKLVDCVMKDHEVRFATLAGKLLYARRTQPK